MRRIVTALTLAALGLTSVATARALPGQRLPVWLAWAKANPALQTLSHGTDEMSGGTIYNKHIKAAGMKFYFAAEPGVGDAGGPQTIFSENLALEGVPDRYDLRAHREVAAQMAKVVYGSAVGSDVVGAAVAGDFAVFDSPTSHVMILKGKRYMYLLNGPGFTVSPLSNLAAALKNAKFCATHQCGD